LSDDESFCLLFHFAKYYRAQLKSVRGLGEEN